jgi:putative membrane protein
MAFRTLFRSEIMRINNYGINTLVRGSLVMLAGAVLLSGPSAIAQPPGGGGTGGAGQQSTSPTQQTPGSQPGASPMDQAASNNQDPNGTSAMMDKAFVRQALQGGMAEVQLGQLALQKSSNPDVKQFAQKMVDDHTKLGDEMKQVAQQMNVKAPDSLSGKDKSTISKLNALNGDEFDKAYIKDMVKDHKQDAKEFKQEAQNASNPALKQVATQGAQVIDQHLQMIEQIAQKNNVAEK